MMQCGLAGSVSPPRWLPDGKAQICQILLPCALLAFVLFIFSPASPLDFSSQALPLLFRHGSICANFFSKRKKSVFYVGNYGNYFMILFLKQVYYLGNLGKKNFSAPKTKVNCS